jgi:hypothetical protein
LDDLPPVRGEHYYALRDQWLEQVQTDHRLGPGHFELAFVISRYLNRDSGSAWPSQSTLAGRLRKEPRHVRNMVKDLARAGHLQVTPGNGRGRSTVYVPLLASAADERGNSVAAFRGEKGNPTSAFTPTKGDRDFRLSPPKGGNPAHRKGGSPVPPNRSKRDSLGSLDDWKGPPQALAEILDHPQLGQPFALSWLLQADYSPDEAALICRSPTAAARLREAPAGKILRKHGLTVRDAAAH